MSLYQELQRRNVIRVATAYIVVAWLVIQIVETIFPAYGFSDKAIRVVVTVFAIGFIPALIGAWLFEITPEGLKRDNDVERSSSGNPNRIIDRVIIVVFGLGLIYFAFDKFILAPERAVEREAVVAEEAKAEAIIGYYGNRSIAVLPFVNMSSDAEQDYFAEGISEEILNLLVRIRELRVISRSSSFALKGRNLDVPEIAEMLGVAHILEGSVRKSGNTVRVTAQLIEAKTDTHLWSKTYDRELESLFAVQDEIAADVARNMHIEILRPLPNSRVIDPEVRALTQQASQIEEIRPEDVGQRMKVLLDRALAIDPNYVPALELMIYADWFLEREGVIGEDELDRRYADVKAKILLLDSENGFIDGGEAWTAAYIDVDLEKAAELFMSAMAKDPADSNIIRQAGQFARSIGRFKDATRILKHATAIDPLCFSCLLDLSRTYLYDGEYDKAEQARTRYLATGGEGGQIHYSLIKQLQGDAKSGVSILADFPSDRAQIIAAKAIAAYSAGHHVEAQESLDNLLRRDEQLTDNYALELSSWMGQNNLAFDLLESLSDQKFGFFYLDIFNPIYTKLWDDPRWDAYREKIGMSEERLAAIKFDYQLPE